MAGFGVLFDMDGVLVDSGPFHEQAWKILANENGMEMEEDFFRRTFGMRNDEILRLLFGGGLDEERVETLGRRKEELYRSIAKKGLRPARGAGELVEDLYENRVPMAIASSGPRENVEMMLEVTGLGKWIQTFVSAEDVERGKPDPEVFLKSAGKIGIDPCTCIVLEDAPVGIEAGKRAGMKVIAVSTTRPPQALKEADIVVRSLKGIRFEDLSALFEPGTQPGH